MNEVKVEIIRKAREVLNLSDKEWADLDDETRNLTLQLIDHIGDPDTTPTTSDRSAVAKGIRKMLNLHEEEYKLIPRWQVDRFLERINDLMPQ